MKKIMCAILSAALLLSILVIPTVAAGPKFSDVPKTHWAYEAITMMTKAGVMVGTGDGKFSPDATCTRAQSVTFLYRASGSPAVSDKAEFSDVSTTAFYADAVAWAAKKGITTGYNTTTFAPEDNCTRAQAVTLLYRAK